MKIDNFKVDICDKFLPLFEPAPYKIGVGGRGSGKSHAFCEALIIQSYLRPLKVLCCREHQNAIRDSSKSLLESKIAKHGLNWFFKITEAEIVGLNGSVFIFKGLQNPGSLNSLDGVDIAFLEESQFNRRASLNLLFPTIRKKGAEIWACLNPRHKEDPIYDMFLTGDPPPGSVIMSVNFYDNPWFSDTNLVHQMEWDRKRDSAKYRHVWLGELEQHSSALVFKNWKVGSFDLPETQRYHYGLDFGFSNDPTAGVRVAIIEGRRLYIDHEIYGFGIEVSQLPNLVCGLPGAERSVVVADSSNPQLIRELQRMNLRVHAAIKGQNSVIEGVRFIQDHDVVIHPRCVNTIREFETYSFDEDRVGNVLPAIIGKDDHCIDACRYALEDSRRSGHFAASVYTYSETGLTRTVLVGAPECVNPIRQKDGYTADAPLRQQSESSLPGFAQSQSQSDRLADYLIRYPPAQSFDPIFVKKVSRAVAENAAKAAQGRRESFLRDCDLRDSKSAQAARQATQLLVEKRGAEASADDYAWRTAKAIMRARSGE